MDKIKIYFDEPYIFDLPNIKPLVGIVGLYFIFRKEVEIPYPFKNSRLIYIGMSEKITNSIGVRLAGHFEGQSGNVGISNYKKIEPLNFTYINFEMLKRVWNHRIEDLESYFISDFVKRYGVYPICNNKMGYEILNASLSTSMAIDWHYFEKGQYGA